MKILDREKQILNAFLPILIFYTDRNELVYYDSSSKIESGRPFIVLKIFECIYMIK